jgi:hypothetical protein
MRVPESFSSNKKLSNPCDQHRRAYPAHLKSAFFSPPTGDHGERSPWPEGNGWMITLTFRFAKEEPRNDWHCAARRQLKSARRHKQDS